MDEPQATIVAPCRVCGHGLRCLFCQPIDPTPPVITHLGRLVLPPWKDRPSIAGLYGVQGTYTGMPPALTGGVVTVKYDVPVSTNDGRTRVLGLTFGVVAVDGLAAALDADSEDEAAAIEVCDRITAFCLHDLTR